MKVGFFTMPMHPPGRNYTETLKEDREAVLLADRLGYSEAYIGEHVTDVCESIPSCLTFIASLAHDTRQIRLGSGTVNLPNNHPVQVAAHVAKRLTETGLYKPEALAMVNTWKSSYFKTEGVRLLFVLPQSWTDRFIPMRIEPTPTELVRVMVGRVELLDAQREKRAEDAIRRLASPIASERERAFETLRAEGRYVEPIVRRALETTTSEQVRTLSRRLLLTDFVTELRTTFTDASTGERVNTEPVFIQAQLASLLREVGLTAEAKQEGEKALAELSRMTQPTMHEHQSRHMFRALARAHEGAGHDGEALAWYGKFVEFGSQFQQPRMCAGCHTTMQPEFLAKLGHAYMRQLDPEVASKIKRARSCLDAGIRMSFNSDRPIVLGDPWLAIKTAIRRPDGFDQSENVTREEAIDLYTRGSAYAEFAEREKGTLEPGKLADVVVFAADLFRLPPREILATPVDLTIVGGRVSHQVLHGLQVRPECGHAAVPGVVRGRGVFLRPVACGKRRGDVFGVAAELQDVPLGDALVLQQPPRGVRRARGPGAAQCRGQARDCLVKGQVGIAPAQKP